MGSKKRIAQPLTAISGALLLAIVGYTVHALEAAPPTPPQAATATAANGAPGAPGLGRGECSKTGRPAAGFYIPQSKTPWCWDVVAMDDAVPTKAYATPKKARKILVLCKAAGFVHSSIPLAAAAIKEIGDRTGAWSTTITYDPADINAQNLQQYDLVFLVSTTGQYLDDPNNKELTTERRQALLNFVRSGKGLAGVHAAVDSYHTTLSMAGFRHGANPAQRRAAMAAAESFVPTGTWPAYNKMIGGFFKWHWPYPQVITVKIDDKKSPLTQMFHGQEFVIHDETYTMAQDSYSLKNVHELTSIDYSKMSQADKDKEPAASRRTDGDYGLSWIRREGKGRVFIEVLGHDEHMYEMPVYLEHLLAGIQYALGDLRANDAPTER
ncbi:MAG: ThuA domain-containing protein [Acidobacteriota bacterium]|nr:ThuA domain-containing protein [Acidobacteriota bacterium]